MSKTQLALFVSPFLPMAAFLLPVTLFLPAFYVETIGIELKLVGTLFLAAKLWDVLTDTLFGYMSDRFDSRWGKRRPWMVLSAPIMMVCSYMIFFPPPGASSSYLLFWLVVTYVGWTMLSLSHLSWSAELSSDYHERSRIQGWMKAFGVAGMLLVCLISIAIGNISWLQGVTAVHAMGAFVIVFIPITVALSVMGTQATVSVQNVQAAQKVTAKEFIFTLIRNKPLLIVLGAAFFITLSNALFASVFVFYTKYVLQLASFGSIALLLYFIAGFVSIPFWLSLSKRLEKHSVFQLVGAYGALSILPFLIVPAESILWGTLAFCLMGANFAIMDILPKSMMADVTDVDLHTSKRRRSGFFFGMLLTTVKIANAAAVGISFWVLDWIGFHPSLDNSPDVIQNFTYFFVFAPFTACLAVIYLLKGYPLTERYQSRIRKEIEGL